MNLKTMDCKRLMMENEELKRNLALSLNKPLIKKLNQAIQRINSGNYVSEDEFFTLTTFS